MDCPRTTHILAADEGSEGKVLVCSPGDGPGELEVVREVNMPYFVASSSSSTEYGKSLPLPVLGSEKGKERRICGLRRSTFFLSVVLVLVIVAAAVGGGVGGSIAVERAREGQRTTPQSQHEITATSTPTSPSSTPSSSATTTQSNNLPTSTSTAEIVVPTKGKLALDCPRIDQTNQTVTLESRTWTFSVRCGTDFAAWDTVAIIAYSLRDCMQACASYNRNADRRNGGPERCAAVVFNADLTAAVPNFYGTCFLKNSTAEEYPGGGDGFAAAVVVGYPPLSLVDGDSS